MFVWKKDIQKRGRERKKHSHRQREKQRGRYTSEKDTKKWILREGERGREKEKKDFLL